MERTGLKRTDELVQMALLGDGRAFTSLWDENISQLRAYVRSLRKSMDDFTVDDICSRSFEKAFRQIDSFDPRKSRFTTWLRTIAHNTALDVLDKAERALPRSQTVYLDDEAVFAPVSETISDQMENALESIIRDEHREKTSGSIEALPELYREIARKRFLDGMQYQEIADELGLNLNTVRTRISRAKKIIDQLSSEDDIL